MLETSKPNLQEKLGTSNSLRLNLTWLIASNGPVTAVKPNCMGILSVSSCIDTLLCQLMAMLYRLIEAVD